MVLPQSSPRRRNGASAIVIGVVLGVMASSFVFLLCQTPPPIRPQMLLQSTLQSSSGDRGWSQIHVFYGDQQHLPDTSTIPREYFATHEWFSQVRQDEIVYQLLHAKKNGYFVDLAANDAVRISNTYALERKGWSGICIEPNPIYWASLSYRNCHVAAAVVGADRMQSVSFKYPNRAGPKGGIVGQDFDNKEPSQYGEDHPRYTVPLQEILERFHAPAVIDYLSLDVEGAEMLVLGKFPFDRYRFQVLTIERPSSDTEKLLQRNGYMLLKNLKRFETLWVHQSFADSINRKALEIDTEHYRYRESTAVQ